MEESIQDLNDLLIKDEATLVGIWSKYNPQGITQQVGIFGLMDSNCFHYQSFIGKSSKSLEQIYFDCLYPESKTIQKFLLFNTKEGQQHAYNVEINPSEYENVWYLFELFYYPSKNILEFIIVKENQILLQKKTDTLLFQENNVKLTVGGGLIVQNSNIKSIEVGSKFSYFSGKMYQVQLSYSRPSNYALEKGIAFYVQQFDDISESIYNNTITSKISDQDLFWLDQKSHISQYLNTDSFIFAGWFRITKIHQVDDEFTYQFQKMSKNTKFEQFSNPNYQKIYYINKQKQSIFFDFCSHKSLIFYHYLLFRQ